jgi:hypothetical protein
MNAKIFESAFPGTLVSVSFGNKDLKVISMNGSEISLLCDFPLEDGCDLDVNINQWEEMQGYAHFRLENCRIIEEVIEKYYTFYRLRQEKVYSEENRDYQQIVSKINNIASGKFKRDPVYAYVHDKMTSQYDFDGIQKPGSLDFKAYMYKTPEQSFEKWFDINIPDNLNRRFRELSGKIDMAVSLSGKKECQVFLENGWNEFTQGKIPVPLRGHGIFSRKFNRLYLGSEFCHMLMPDMKQIDMVIRKVADEGISLTAALSYIPGYCLEKACLLIDFLQESARKNGMNIELAVNDWGIIEYVSRKKFSNLSCSMGRLLNKRKKDPRISEKIGSGIHKDSLRNNNLNIPRYGNFLKNKGITRFEFESHPSGNKIPDGKHSLHFPFYQCNTSQYCPLHAEMKNGSRKLQTPVKDCPGFCSYLYGSYPDCYPMILKGNTVFAFDDTLLTDPAILEQYLESGIDRLVFNGTEVFP